MSLASLPEAQRAVGDREFGPPREPAPLQVKEQLPPGLRALTHAINEPDEFLLALGRRADDHQQALRFILEPSLNVDAVDPEVDVALGGQVAITPMGMLVDPGLLQARDGRSG